MSLQFILGDGRRDHQKEILKTALQWLETPYNEVFFIVPNYNKFEREKEILHLLKEQQASSDFTSIRAQVYSFHRLSWYYLQQTGLLNPIDITETGASMIMRKLLEELQDQLVVYRGEISKAGFVQQLLDLYQEMQASNITSEDLLIQAQVKTAAISGNNALKFSELALIFQRYEQELISRDVQVSQPMSLLTSYLQQKNAANASEKSADLSHSLYIISGFSAFSAQEQELLGVLMEQGHVVVDLFLDKPYPHEMPQTLDLFFEAGKSYHQLINIGRSAGVKILVDKHCELLMNAAYQEVESFWRLTQNNGTYKQVTVVTDFLELWKVGNPEEEVRQIAAEIRELISKPSRQGQPLRYRDIQVLVLEQEIYHQYIPKIFTEYEIPYYIDEERMMAQHPLVEFLNALFSLEAYNYRLNDIFRLLRTELYLPKRWQRQDNWLLARDDFRKMVDITENKALAHNFQGQAWTGSKDWQLVEFNFEAEQLEETKALEEYTNTLRQDFRQEIVLFLKNLKKAKTNFEATQKLYKFLLAAGVEAQLLHWRDQALENGALDQARNHEQTWQALMDLLDEFVEIYGDRPFNYELFEEILSSGLENLTFGKIPTAIDQVNINRFDLARPLQAKITFVPGLNDTVLPSRTENHTLLTNEERERLNAQLSGTKFIRDTVEETTTREPATFYTVLLSASEKIYLSFAANFDTKQNLQMSPYLQRMLKWLDVPLQERGILTLESDPHFYVGTYRSLIYQINNLKRQALQQKKNLSYTWRGLEQQLLTSGWKELAQKVFGSQTYQNIPAPLSRNKAIELYGTSIYSSISRMETFYQCEYRYFVNYGLQLKEREVYGLNPAMTGEFFHDALDQFLKVLVAENLSLTNLTEMKRQLLVERVLAEIFGQVRYNLLNSSARMNFIRYQLGKTIQRVSWALAKQGQKMHFTPEKTEVLFGQIAGHNGIDGLELPLSTGGKLYLRGKIDRIDTAEQEGEKWLSVVDYKSSSREFDVSEAYYGLAMQLVTYLDVALRDAIDLVGTKNVRPAGAYYLHVHDPLLDGQSASEEERLKRYKYDGLFVDDPEVFSAYDHSLEASKNSLLFPIRKDKNELYQKVSQSKNKFYTEDEIRLLRQHNRKNLQAGAEKLLSGEISLNPSYKVKDKKRACEFCPFRSVCDFDVMLPENDYHRLENLPKEEILKRIREEEND